MIEPFLKWTGGKRQLVDVLRPMILERIRGRYFEPFLGGGAIALSMPDGVYRTICGDVCYELILTWQTVASSPRRVADELEEHRRMHCRDYYYRVRDGSQPTSAVEIAARMIYLNKTCFNGLYRINSSGRFNVPIGRGRSTSIPTETELIAISRRVRGWSLACCPAIVSIEVAQDGDVVYADPPYDGAHDYSSNFGDDDQRRLAEALRHAARRGVRIISTNADTSLVRSIYSWAEVTPIGERRRVAADTSRRQQASCLLITR